jgi:ABC-2 type transport system permease protein
MISLQRIRGLLRQEWHISRRSFEIIGDLPFFATIDLLVVGYISTAITNEKSGHMIEFLLLGVLLWEVTRISQYCLTVNSFWNIWSRNLSNIFISPLSLTEYLCTQMLSGLLKALIILTVLLAPLARWLFHFDLFSLGGVYLSAIIINLLLFSWSLGLALLGTVFRYGMRVQALGWTLIYLFQPLSAVFYPLSIMPPAMQKVALLIPITYVFEGARATLVSGAPAWDQQIIALLLNGIFFVASLFLFTYLFYRSRDSGQFVRNEN